MFRVHLPVLEIALALLLLRFEAMLVHTSVVTRSAPRAASIGVGEALVIRVVVDPGALGFTS